MSRAHPLRPGRLSCPGTAPRPRPGLTVVALGAFVLLTAGCGLLAPDGSGAGGTGTNPTGTTGSTAAATGSVTSADEVRTTGTVLDLGDLTLRWAAPTDAPDAVTTVDEDGAVTVAVTTGEDGTALLLAAPEDVTAEELSDGSVVLRRDGVFVAGATAVGAGGAFAPAVTVRDDGLVVWTGEAGDGATVTLAVTAVRSATWADRADEGGRSLAVVPSTWARTGGLAAEEGVWAQLIALVPEADTQAMHDQLTCHTIGAQDKESWNLEPWRPDVGLLATLAARCNPSA